MTEGRAKGRQRLPFKVDPFRFAQDEVELDSVLPVSGMKRLSAMLHRPGGELDIQLAFAVDELGTTTLKGRLRTCLQLLCQRCLEPVRVEVDAPLALGFARSEAGLEAIPATLDPVLAESGQVDLPQLLEDEILLALPQIPRHAQGECRTAVGMAAEPAEASSEKRENPFSVLAGLKKSDQAAE